MLCNVKLQHQFYFIFILYIWGGNVEDKKFRLSIEKSISEFDLEKNIKIVDHPFVPYNDIKQIENRTDFFIQISEHLENKNPQNFLQAQSLKRTSESSPPKRKTCSD